MMAPIRFQPSEHLEEVSSWAKVRGMGEPPADLLPPTGRIVPGVCAVFLYLTDSSVGFIENLISNPDAEPEAITEGISACVKSLEEDAKENHVRFMWGSSFIPGVAKRAKDLGFQVSRGKYILISKGLS